METRIKRSLLASTSAELSQKKQVSDLKKHPFNQLPILLHSGTFKYLQTHTKIEKFSCVNL